MEDTIDVASKLQRFMKEQLKNLSTIITSGGVDNMEDYRYILAKFVHTNFYYRKSLTCLTRRS